MLKKALMSSGVLLGVSALASRLLGLLRDHLLAANFGALSGSGIFDLDTYYAAFRLPDLLFNLLIYGTLSSAFVPLFVNYIKNHHREEANRFASAIFNISTVLIIALCVFIGIFAQWLVPLFVPGFSGEKLTLTIMLTRILLVAPVFFTISAVFQSIENSLKTFFYYALAPIMYNISIIVSIIVLAPRYGVIGIAWGVVCGAVLHMGIQLPALLRAGIKYYPIFDYNRRDVREMITLTIPRMIGLSISQFNLIIETLIGSTLITGSITIMNYATNLQSLPIGIIGISAAIASFSTLALQAHPDALPLFTRTLSENIQRIMLLIIPATFGMFTLRFQIVRLVFGRGKFGWEDTILTANTLGILLIGLFAHSLIFLMARAFYAWKDTKTPVAVSIAAVVLNIFLSIYLVKIVGLGIYGLAIGSTVAAILNITLLFNGLLKKLSINAITIIPFKALGVFLIASIVMTLFVQMTKVGIGLIFNDINTYVELTIQTLVSIAIGVVVYFTTCSLFSYRLK